jgi:hypothetical protein
MPWVEITVALISAATTLGAVLLSSYLKNKITHNRERNVKTRIRRDTEVYQILNDIRKKFNFSRVSIIQFHNGTKYYTGESIQKASVSFETVSPGVKPMANSMQDVPLGTMTYSLYKLAMDGKLCIPDVNNCEDERYANLMRAYDEISHYSFKIEDDSGWIGVLSADHTMTQPDLSEACCEWMKIQASRLSILLSLHNRSHATNE